jgi:hypothetical protein
MDRSPAQDCLRSLVSDGPVAGAPRLRRTRYQASQEGPVTATGTSLLAQRTIKKVRVLQETLYRAAKENPRRTFGVLYDKVCRHIFGLVEWGTTSLPRAQMEVRAPSPYQFYGLVGLTHTNRFAGLMLFAGLYESWHPEKDLAEMTFTIGCVHRQFDEFRTS